jgi:uncharacterized protein
MDEAPQVAVTGASGLVGTALTRFLSAGGHRVVPLVRSRDSAEAGGGIYWNPAEGQIDVERLEGLDGVVHLAGENLASGRWTNARKRRIWDSRIDGTRLLSEALAGLQRKPRVLVSASGINYYGDRGADPVDESAPPGTGFLPDLCRAWEDATAPAGAAGIRVVCMRTGVVLSPAGGALAQLAPLFKLGLGGRLGRGDQYMSWVHIDDHIAAILHALTASEVEGPVNAVSPEPVTNAEFTRTLATVLRRPALLPVPGAALKLAIGRELAEQALLGGVRAYPRRLTETGFHWRYAQLEIALRHLLGR